MRCIETSHELIWLERSRLRPSESARQAAAKAIITTLNYGQESAQICWLAAVLDRRVPLTAEFEQQLKLPVIPP
jgi:hypothetical protein